MCKYCDISVLENLRAIQLSSPIELKPSTGFWLQIDEYNGRFYLNHIHSDEESKTRNFYVHEIKYCPMCGRMLGEE